MMKYLQKTIEFVDESFGVKSPHFERTLYWVKRLYSKADQALQIAAYCHDIDRSTWINYKNRASISRRLLLHDSDAIRNHEEHSAEMMHDFLIENGADEILAEKVKHLVSRHEEGGDVEQNLLKDADSLSYFETNSDKHIAEIGKFTVNEIKEKTDYMFNRISSEKAKKIAKPLYEKAVKLLEKAFAAQTNH